MKWSPAQLPSLGHIIEKDVYMHTDTRILSLRLQTEAQGCQFSSEVLAVTGRDLEEVSRAGGRMSLRLLEGGPRSGDRDSEPIRGQKLCSVPGTEVTAAAAEQDTQASLGTHERQPGWNLSAGVCLQSPPPPKPPGRARP